MSHGKVMSHGKAMFHGLVSATKVRRLCEIEISHILICTPAEAGRWELA